MRPAQLPAPELTETEILKKRIDELEAELATTREEYESQRLERIQAMQNMPEVRRLYSMLCLLFGHEDGEAHHVTSIDESQPIPSSRYDAWKERLAPSCGKVIDALLVQPMTHRQLNAYCKMSFYTVRDALAVLKANQLIDKDGERIKLRRL